MSEYDAVLITMTNLLVLAIVVSHSCIMPAHIQEDYAGTSISSDEVSASAQPVSQLQGAAPSPKPVPQTRSPSQLKDEFADELTYKAYLASARAFANVKEKSKAIESYEKAILVAPNRKCREAVIEELNSFSAKHRWRWFLDSFTLFLQKIQSNWVWVFLVLLLLPAYFLLRRFIRGLLPHKKSYRLLILPTSGSEFATYFCDLIRYAHDSFEEQRVLVRQISRLSSRTIAPTCQSAELIAELPFKLPDVFASKWWSPLVNPVVNKIDPPNYTVRLGISNAEKQYDLTIQLCKRSQFLNHWHKSSDNVNVHCILRDLAYQVVVNINQQKKKRP